MTRRFKNFDVSHGLQGSEFNLNAALASKAGQLFFGGSNGFNAFHSEQIVANKHLAPVAFTGLQKLNKKTGTVSLPLTEDKYTFGYQDYAITFEFAGLDFEASEQNLYQYKLEGFDQDWVHIGKTRRTTFTNLPPDEYVFRVKAANNDGIWSENGAKIGIQITPPPWRTWWAYGLYGLLVSGIVFWFVWANRKKLKEKAAYSLHLENQVKLRTAELTELNHALADAKEQAEVGNRSKGTFIATMSHELRTPMTSIIGFAESILTDNTSQQESHRRINKILRNARHLLQLMNSILDLSKIEAEQLEIEAITTSPVVLLQELEELIGQTARHKNLKFTLDYQLPLPAEIISDPTRLKQILLNLSSNAIKFTESGGITVRLSATQEQLRFDVIDTGIGIPSDKQESVFQTFSQADSSINRKFGGAGLGLSISKQLAELMGGGMSLTSEEGKGSQFSFCIALKLSENNKPWLEQESDIAEQLAQKRQQQWHIPSLKGHILLAEDWPDNQELIQMYIRRTGAHVTLVENGQQAVEAALVGDFELLLMDVQMPEVDGVEATQILRATVFSKPIIALTANVSKDDIASYLTSGFDGHLSKPIDSNAFYAKFAELLPESNKPNNGDSRLDNEASSQEFLQLKASFLTRLPELQSQIETLTTAQDWPSLNALLHNLKGMGGSFGYSEITRLAEELCLRLDKGQLDNLSQLISELTALLHQTSLGVR